MAARKHFKAVEITYQGSRKKFMEWLKVAGRAAH